MDVTGLSIGTMYYFTVSATNLIGEGPQSTQEAILAAEKPSAPAAPIIAAQSSTSITISWVAPNN